MRKTRLILFFTATLIFLSAGKVVVSANEFCFKVVADNKEYIYYYPQIVYDAGGEKRLVGIDSEVDRICKDCLVFAKDATVIFNPESEQIFYYTSQKDGRFIDKKQLKFLILRALALGKSEVKIKSKPLKPTVTQSELKQNTKLIATFSTFYGYSTSERKNNVMLATKFISGTILQPNQSFSFNQTVGARSEERGFLPAKVIENGEFTSGIGGGVCQVSTTLYNAVLLCGLQVTESHQHSILVGYVNPSFDAMVSENFCDLKFINPFSFPIYIQGIANGENLTFNIYGKKSDYEYKLVSKVLQVINPQKTVVYTQDKTLKNVVGKAGLKSEGYLQIFLGDSLIKTVKLRQDSYKPINEVEYIFSDQNSQ